MAKYSNHGSRMRPIYTAVSTAPLIVIKTGEEDQYEMIQASKDSVLLENLVARALDGDVSALDQAHGMYGDFSDVPTNLAEVLDAYTAGVAAYERLSPTVRETYGSIGDLLEALASGDFDSKFISPEGRPEKEAESGDVNE